MTVGSIHEVSGSVSHPDGLTPGLLSICRIWDYTPVAALIPVSCSLTSQRRC